ncbi:MAG: hypothetical protein N3E49_02435 [Bacteroidia bacterium]|nr:hypothetical protein [Bacteroidia bacterium]
MRYAQHIIAGALLWAVTACAPKPSQEFIQSVQQEFQTVEQSLSDKIKQVESDVSSLQDPFASLKSELGKTWTDKVEKDKAIKERLDALSQRAQQLSTEFNTARNELNSTLSEAKAFVDGLASQQKKDEDLKPEWEGQKNKLSEKQAALDKVAGGVSELQSQVNELTEEIKKKYAPKK